MNAITFSRVERKNTMSPLDQITQTSEEQSELTMSVLMTPDMANFSGNVHGEPS